MKRKIISILLSFCLLFTMLPVNVFANPTELQLNVVGGIGIQAVYDGTIDIEIEIYENPGIMGLNFEVHFDQNVLALITNEHTQGANFPSPISVLSLGPGVIAVGSTFPAQTTAEDVFITLSFDVIGDIGDTSPINLINIVTTIGVDVATPNNGLVTIVGAGVRLPPDLRIIPNTVIVPTRMVGYQSQIPGVGLVNNRGGGAPISAVILLLNDPGDHFELFPDFLPALNFIINDLNVDLFDGDLDDIMNNIADAVIAGLQDALEDALQGETLPTLAELEALVPAIPNNPNSQDLVDFVTILLDNVATFVDDYSWVPGATVDFVQIVTDGVMGILTGIPEWNEWWNGEFVILPMWPGGYFPFAVRPELGRPVGIHTADLYAIDVMELVDHMMPAFDEIVPIIQGLPSPLTTQAILGLVNDLREPLGRMGHSFHSNNGIAALQMLIVIAPLVSIADDLANIGNMDTQAILTLVPTLFGIVNWPNVASQIESSATAEVRFRVIEKTYKVTFVTDGTGNGTLTPAEPVVVRVPATAPNNHVVDTQVPTVTPNAGYTFHWTSNRHPGTFDCNGLLGLDITKKNTVFTAVFVPIQQQTWTVTFDSTTGSAVASQVVADGGFATLPTPAPTRANHTFAGWYTVLTGGTQFNFATTPITSDITLFARWTSVTPPPNGPTGPSGGGATPPVVITPPEVPLAPFVADHVWYVRGFPDGSFRPGQSITRAEVAMILWRLLDSNAKYTQRGNNFSDVSTGWYAQAVSYLAFRNIITGFPDGTFRPNNPITRAELVAMMSRFFDMDENGVNNFSDVADTHWALAYIMNAYSQGWVEGFPDGTFRPGNATNRAEAVTVINRVLGRIPNPQTIDYHLENSLYEVIGVTVLFNDITSTHWAFYQIMEAAIEHEFDRDDQGREVWTSIEVPWFEITDPAL